MLYDEYLRQQLDPETRRYWQKHIPLHGRRINMFARNLYRYSLLGRFIGVLHVVARLHGKKLERLVIGAHTRGTTRAFRPDYRATVRLQIDQDAVEDARVALRARHPARAI